MNEQFRLRICYAKQGRLRWLSLLELTRAMERLVRRSGLPYVVTQGFNRHMRFASGPALPVGTAGESELFDVWLTTYVPPEAALVALRQAAGGMISVVDATYVPLKAKGLQATHVVNEYRLVLQSAKLDCQAMQAALDALIAVGNLEVLVKDKPRSFDLKAIVIDPPKVLSASDIGSDCYQMNCTLLNTSAGALRPEQLVAATFGNQCQTILVERIGLREL
ncbi:MAG: TIGR03936 family radical SAM-associated protein [Coriobacteriales bacterium]|jgi:radical SAM-linked protein|nr:TIGR03936 family radical SAM-associated protein [Coriobacteriales bacterium]